MSYPEGIVETKIGKLRIVANGRHTLYVTGDIEQRDQEGRKVHNPISVRGVNYSVSLHLENYGSGYELHKNQHGSTYDAYYFSREGRYSRNDGVSDSARKVLIETMLAAAQTWVLANPKAPILAGIHAEEYAFEGLMSKRAELENEIAELNRKVAESRDKRLVYVNSLEEIGK